MADRAALLPLVGEQVVLGMPRSMGDGALTLRWGTLLAVTDTHAVVGGYHDSAGIGAYVGGSYVHDGVEVPLADVVTVRKDTRRA